MFPSERLHVSLGEPRYEYFKSDNFFFSPFQQPVGATEGRSQNMRKDRALTLAPSCYKNVRACLKLLGKWDFPASSYFRSL